MANYTFLDASGNSQTAASSTIANVQYPIVKVPDLVNVVGSVELTGSPTVSIAGIVNVNSIIGTYLENATRNAGGVGFYNLGTRNDTLVSIVAGDVRLTPIAIGPVGEQIVANAPITKWVRATNSVFSGTSVQVMAAQGASVFTYITGVHMAVAGGTSTSVLATFTTGLGGVSSIIGWATANVGAMADLYLPNAWLSGANSGISASISGQASIYVAMEGFISKT